MQKKKEVRQRNCIAKDLYVNAKFKHKVEKSYKERIKLQEESEQQEEIAEYLKGTAAERDLNNGETTSN